MGKDGRGSIISKLKKKKLNTKSSTEAELIGADDAMPQMIWTSYFLEAKVYGIDENILHQCCYRWNYFYVELKENQ